MRARDPAQTNFRVTPFDLSVMGYASVLLGSVPLVYLGGCGAGEDEEEEAEEGEEEEGSLWGPGAAAGPSWSGVLEAAAAPLILAMAG